MGLIYADIELINAGDIEMARRHIIGEEEIKRMPVTMLVDSGSEYTCINETIREQLDLPTIKTRKGQLADGRVVEYDVVGPIKVVFSNRACHTDAMVLPGDNEPLFGAITMEDLDVIIHPHRREMVVNPEHPYYAQMKLKGMPPKRTS